MTSRRAFLKAGAALTAVGCVAQHFHSWQNSSPLLIVSPSADVHTATRVAEQLAGGMQSRHLADDGDTEALLIAVGQHLRAPGRTVIAMASPATTLLLNVAFRDAKARLIEDRHLAARPLIIARS